MDSSTVAAVAAVLAVFEVPIMAGLTAAWRWSRKVDQRLANIEARSHNRREDDRMRQDH